MDYLLRNIDSSLWREFKARCSQEGFSIKDVIIAFIREYVK